MVNTILNDKEELLNNYSAKELKDSFNKNGLKASIVDELINDSKEVIIDQKESILKIDKNVLYHIYDNQFVDDLGNDITKESIIKYTIKSSYKKGTHVSWKRGTVTQEGIIKKYKGTPPNKVYILSGKDEYYLPIDTPLNIIPNK